MRGVSTVAAVLASVLAVSAPAEAKTLSDISGPANLPPPGYAGRQFVDNDGCIFVRGGYGGMTNWVPRVQRNKTVMCGYTPTFRGGTAVAEAPSARSTASAPARTPPVATAVRATPVLAAPVVAQARPALQMPVAVPSGTYVSPYMSASATTPATIYGPIYATGAAAAPTCGAGFVTAGCVMAPAAPAPVRTAAAAPARSHTITAIRGMGIEAGKPLKPRQAEAITRAVRHAELKNPPAPRGYVSSWQDGRLNPYRGPQTQLGDQQMDQIWTDEVPMRMVTETAPRPQVRVRMVPGSTAVPSVRISSGNAPEAVGKPRYVQVGAFASAANAQAAVARIQAAGLPAAVSRSTMKGKAVQVVMAGPFSGSSAKSALSQLRARGFGDAVLR